MLLVLLFVCGYRFFFFFNNKLFPLPAKNRTTPLLSSCTKSPDSASALAPVIFLFLHFFPPAARHGEIT